ncbi:zinc finger protein ZAT1-like [Gastrolobium bilobum]|uniref:zinc finger protein ZAT1-like n=1 Tax=Gastrolobium bilobum TaxID=150636 RepID=UPI002AB0777B|nr:zinc finger protein ZAT1-like [Gastrolobium bilobum]
MDCDQENKFDDDLHQKDDDKKEGLDHAKNSSEEKEKMNSPVPSESSEVGNKPKGKEGSPDQKSAASGIHKCVFCGKEFKCGKALGGHKRFHLQAQKKKEKEDKKAAISNEIKMSSLMSNGKHCCLLCDKDFPSQKSLYGHMRSHPDRVWRGVCPPTRTSDKQGSSSPNSASIEEIKHDNFDFGAVVVAPNKPAIDLSKILPPTWRKTYRRGRESLYSAETFEASKIIMSLSKGSLPCDKNKKGKQLIEFEDEKEKEEEHRYAKWIREECNYVKKMKRAWNGMNTHEASSSGVKDHLQPRDAYQCNICDKSFSTFQALGGHKSSHNKEKNNKPPNDVNIGESSQSGQKNSLPDLNEVFDLMDDEES